MLNNQDNYEVETEVFQGPLDLLLHLIEKRKLHICDISLLQITDDYLAYLKKLEDFPIKNSVDFVLTASILMLIKSRSLLPTLDLTLEEEQSIDDLEKRLKEYQEIKRLSQYVSEMFGKQISFRRQWNKNIEPVFSPDEEINPVAVYSAIRRVLNNLPKKILSPKVSVQKIVSLEKMIGDLTNRMKASINMSFKDFAGMKKDGFSKEDKVKVVVSFLAMLELVKQGAILAKQSCQFGDIDMQTQAIEVPNYD